MRTFGGDFEFHITNKEGNAIFAEPILGIDKNAYISSDYSAAEIRPAASDNIGEFIKNIRELLKESFSITKGALCISPVMFLSKNNCDLDSIEIVTEKTSKEFNAYYNEILKRVLINDHLRSQGAHLWLNPGSYKMLDLVKILDMFIAAPLASVFTMPAEIIRKRKYGKAGSYRTNSNLLEYRVLSSSVIRHPIILTEILRLIETILDNKKKVELVYNQILKTKLNPQHIINTGSIKDSKELIELLLKISKEVSCPPVKRQIERFNYMIEYVKRLDIVRMDGEDLKEAWLL